MPIFDNPSLQLYTLRDAIAADFAGTMDRVAAIGYRRVEPYNFVASVDELEAAFASTGLVAPSAHVGLLSLDDQRPAFKAAARLGIGIVIDPHVDRARWTTADDIAQTAAQLNSAAKIGAEFGITVGYHNHHFELENRIDDRFALDLLIDALDPAVVLEIDTYWAQVGGADPVELLKRLGERVVAIHIKDGDGTLDTKKQVAVGAGSLPIEAIVAAAPSSAIGVVELDDTSGDVFEAITDSFTYLTGKASA
ncbi:sugar phosphate isomerase/epimerase family protein [Mycetocola zhadangensis]|uniref:Sugar phosphate isomerase/epimerase n=1 Tax=Mycetocola zhadangensis TaxID=1164595 RepID=A0A3L7ISL9_9MICO|nr:sugar phosphate isomerase/epimerase [Mycetocola zhadangensis]RLQ81218.1 sugar phosphate isomerase/epimerase [Mycetocola zhadangensis]GGF04750.1 xylose isomerase [Mycetocola zhadangensis]